MAKIEYAVDEWDLRGRDGELDVGELSRHLQRFGDEGWELAAAAFRLPLKGIGEGHLFVFCRAASETASSGS
jgi:hypothetical protein